MKHGKRIFLGLLAGIMLMPLPVLADDGETKKPPIIVKQGNTTYVFKSQNDKFRNILLNSKNLRIRHRDRDDSDYYRHHKYIRDHENSGKRGTRDDMRDAAYYSGYAAGYLSENDRSYRE